MKGNMDMVKVGDKVTIKPGYNLNFEMEDPKEVGVVSRIVEDFIFVTFKSVLEDQLAFKEELEKIDG